ncbi:putative reverse transcriptase domain-containing protein, partial [Tanacetum coccineum]
RRSLMTYVLVLSPASGALSSVRADLIPSPKRVKDFDYLAGVEVDSRESFEPSRSRRTDVRVDDDIKRVDESHSEHEIDPVQVTIEACFDFTDIIRSRGINVRVVAEIVEERATKGAYETLGSLVQRFHDHTVAILVHRVQRGITGCSEARKMPNTRSGASMTHEEIEDFVSRRVAEEIEAREAAMNLKPLNESGDEQEGENGGNGNRGNGGNGNKENRNGNGGRNENGNNNGNHGMNYGGFMPVARECTFQDFLKYKPHNFSGTEGIVGLTRWFEKMETVFNISNCPSKYQVKYATRTLQDNALTWWNSHKRTIGVDAAYAMKWARLMKLMTEVYCPRNGIQKMETELWNMNVKGNDLTAYTQRFQELILLCSRMVLGGQSGEGYAARSAENKKWMESNPRDNHRQQLPFKRQNDSGQNVARAYTTRNNERRGSGHVKRDCPKLRNQNHGNRVGNKTGIKTGNNEATTRAYAIGGGGANPDSNVVTGTFILNNYYASILFDLGADRSFVLSTFSTLLDVAPFTLDTSYAVELADGRISKTNIILRGCTLGLLGHPFDINLMPVELVEVKYHIMYKDPRVHLEGMPSLSCASYVQEGRGQVGREATRGRADRVEFYGSLSRRVAWTTTCPTS